MFLIPLFSIEKTVSAPSSSSAKTRDFVHTPILHRSVHRTLSLMQQHPFQHEEPISTLILIVFCVFFLIDWSDFLVAFSSFFNVFCLVLNACEGLDRALAVLDRTLSIKTHKVTPNFHRSFIEFSARLVWCTLLRVKRAWRKRWATRRARRASTNCCIDWDDLKWLLLLWRGLNCFCGFFGWVWSVFCVGLQRIVDWDDCSEMENNGVSRPSCNRLLVLMRFSTSDCRMKHRWSIGTRAGWIATGPTVNTCYCGLVCWMGCTDHCCLLWTRAIACWIVDILAVVCSMLYWSCGGWFCSTICQWILLAFLQ